LEPPNGGRKVKEVIAMTISKEAVDATPNGATPNGATQLEASAQGEVSERATKADEFESTRLTYGFKLLLFGLGSILVMFVLVTVHLGDRFDTAASVLSLITTTTTVIGTLVGFYFGAQVGASGFARADINRQETTQQAQQIAQQATQQAQQTARQAVTTIGVVGERAKRAEVDNGRKG
jgi:hypothetical protein